MAITVIGATNGSASGDYTADIATGLNNGDDIFVAIFTDVGGTPIPTPSGWNLVNEDNGGAIGSRQLFHRRRVTGDTTQLFDVAAGGSYARVTLYMRGGFYVAVRATENTNTAAANTPIPFPALTVQANSASLIFGFWAGTSGGVGPGTGYTEASESTRVWGGYDLTLTAGSLTPPDATANSGVTQRYGIHVEYSEFVRPRRALMGVGA